jgi:glucose-6-phosphate 1-dehydrogenase
MPSSATPRPRPAAARDVGPCLCVLYGGTGDLSRRKVLPALFRLHAQGAAENCYVLACSKGGELDDASYREVAVEALASAGIAREEAGRWAEARLFYHAARGSEPEDFRTLAARIAELEARHQLPGNRVFYLALPPAAFGPTAAGLAAAGLARGPGWSRIVVEKPFGRDLASARELNATLHHGWKEPQIYRIDHYLGKETVQNLLVFRFANAMFESVWNREHVARVEITVAEELGVERRAAYYEQAGAVRDIVQNHLTQLLSLVAMEAPVTIAPDAIRAEKVKALRSIRAIDPAQVVWGQYDAGRLDGTPVRAYRAEPGVARDSNTETFVAIRVDVDSWRWQGVPFVLRAGKRMPGRMTEIALTFREPPVSLFGRFDACRPESDALVIRLQPDEGFALYFDVKKPGSEFALARQPLHFMYSEAFGPLPEAYETLLLDIFEGDQTLFVHADEVEESWRLYTPLLDMPHRVELYPAGSRGPASADRLSADGTPSRHGA